MSSVMDLNASPLPEDDEEYFEQHSAEDVMPHGHESSVETLLRYVMIRSSYNLWMPHGWLTHQIQEREERRQRMRSDLVDDRPVRKNRPLYQDEGPQLKKFKSDRNKLPPGWLDCPNFGQEIAFIIPSKVPLDESFNDCIPAGKRYSFRQVLFRVKNFKVGMVVDLTNTNRYYSTSDFKKQGVKYLKEKQENIVLMTNDDVLGDKIPDEQEFQLRRLCLNMLQLPAPTRGNSQFPGSHPVSLDRENLQLLRQRYYYATWKADGTRYMLLLCADGCYMVDRSFKFRRVQMRFPCKNWTECHHFTLLDGEMIIDTIGSEKQERRYLIYDLIALNRVSMIERPFWERWKLIDKEIIEPRNHDREHPKAPYRYDLEPFRVRRKDFWLLSTARKLLRDFIPKLSHEADGLIFQGWDDPYVPRTHEGLLKWKYPEMNSVDFLFEIREDGAECLYLNECGKKRLMDNNSVVFGDAFEPASSYSGKIIECSWDSEENVWICMRVRVDKSTPNAFNTYRKVMKSIKDNITEEVLLNEIDEIISLPMYAERIQIDSRSQKKGKQPPKKM